MKVLLFLCVLLVGWMGHATIIEDDESLKEQRRLGSAKPRKVGPVPQSETVEFLVALPLPNQDQLTEFIADLYDPTSDSYQQYVTPNEFRDRFGPTQDQVDQVTSLLESKSLKVVGVAANNFYLTVHGKVKHVNKAFQVGLTSYINDADGSYLRGPGDDESVQLPEGVLAVIGLDNKTVYEHRSSIQGKFLAPNVSALDKYGYVTVNKLRKVYNFSSKYTGKGQIGAVIQFDNYDQADIEYFRSFWNITIPVVQNILLPASCQQCCTKRRPKGVRKCKGRLYPCYCIKPPTKPGKGAIEVVLDMSLMLSIAPSMSNLLVYIAPNSGKGSIEMYTRIATDNNASVISTSWGQTDTYLPPNYVAVHNNIFMQMAAQGQSNFVASGDTGAYDDEKTISVDFPASIPYVTGVGGTTLQNLTADGHFAYETSWNNVTFKYGGGGGFTHWFSLPSYQNGSISAASKCSSVHRNVPDVSLVADTVPGYAMYFQSDWIHVGGTSAAAPSWAAFMVLVNEYRASIGKGRVGFVNPAMYSLSRGPLYNKMFRDIKDNSTNRYYPAVPGYDCSTGLGTLMGDNLMLGLGGCPAGKSLSADVKCV